MTIKANVGRDIVVTWPQSRSLESYLDELDKAWLADQHINYRVRALPREQPERCYVVHTGYVRGWNAVVGMAERDDVIDPITGDRMASGLYIVRDPRWHMIVPEPMRGFQGWRYYQRKADAPD